MTSSHKWTKSVPSSQATRSCETLWIWPWWLLLPTAMRRLTSNRAWFALASTPWWTWADWSLALGLRHCQSMNHVYVCVCMYALHMHTHIVCICMQYVWCAYITWACMCMTHAYVQCAHVTCMHISRTQFVTGFWWSSHTSVICHVYVFVCIDCDKPVMMNELWLRCMYNVMKMKCKWNAQSPRAFKRMMKHHCGDANQPKMWPGKQPKCWEWKPGKNLASDCWILWNGPKCNVSMTVGSFWISVDDIWSLLTKFMSVAKPKCLLTTFQVSWRVAPQKYYE